MAAEVSAEAQRPLIVGGIAAGAVLASKRQKQEKGDDEDDEF